MGTIKTIKPKQFDYVFTCKSCGSHSFIDTVTNVYQKDRLTDRKLRVCRGCKKAEGWVDYNDSNPEGWTKCD